MSKRFKKVKLPFRKPTEYEKFQSFLRHEEAQAARKGMETYQEANDFDIPEEPDPLENYFGKETRHELAGRFADAGGVDALNSLLVAAKTKKATTPALDSKEGSPASPNTPSDIILGVNRENNSINKNGSPA